MKKTTARKPASQPANRDDVVAQLSTMTQAFTKKAQALAEKAGIKIDVKVLLVEQEFTAQDGDVHVVS